jgi:hypothetical protein
VGAVLVVVSFVGGQDLSGVGFVQDEDVIEYLAPDRAGSRSRKRRDSARVPRSAVRFRACCTAHSRVGLVVTPVMCRRRVPCSRNASAYSLWPRAVSRWKKSAAMMPWALVGEELLPGWAGASRCRGDARRVRISQTVDAAIGWSRRASSPWIRLWPHCAFSRASCRMSLFSAARSEPSRAGALGAVVPLGRDAPAMPGQERAGLDREDFGPAATGYQAGECGQPEPVRGLVADRAGDLPA